MTKYCIYERNKKSKNKYNQLKEKITFYLNNKPEQEITIDYLFYE